MIDKKQASEYLELRLSEALAEIEELERALQEVKLIADSSRILLYHERTRGGVVGEPVPERAIRLLTQPIPTSLIEIAKQNGGEISVDEAVDRLVEAGVCPSKAQARSNVHSALSRLSRPGKAFIRLGRSRYRLRDHSEPTSTPGDVERSRYGDVRPYPPPPAPPPPVQHGFAHGVSQPPVGLIA